MTLRRVLGILAVTAGMALPAAAGAQAPGDASLAAATSKYFTAIAEGDAGVLAQLTAPSFRALQPDGTVLTFRDFIGAVSLEALGTLPPRGNSQTIRSVAIMPAGATESVVAQRWWDGAPVPAMRTGATRETEETRHELTWTKGPGGDWLVAEDRTTSVLRY